MSFTTLTILDGGGTSRTLRVWDESGAGTGPYSFGQTLVNGTTALTDTTGIKISSSQIGTLGQATLSASVPTAPASDWVGTTALGKFGQGYYVACPVNATTTLQSATGAIGDYISGVLVIPGTVNPSSVTLLDNVTSMPVFTGGTASVSNLVPFFIALGAVSRSGAWKITTGATNVTCIAIGKFS